MLSIERIRELIKRERLYVLMLAFILLFNAGYILAHKIPGIKEGFLSKRLWGLDLGREKEFVETQLPVSENLSWAQLLEKQKPLFVLFNTLGLLMLAVLSLGFFLDIRILMARVKKRQIIQAVFAHPAINWGIEDIFRLSIIFIFLGYIINILEWQLIWPFRANENIPHYLSLINTGIMDLMLLGFIAYFVRIKYGQELSAIGLKIKNVARLIWLAVLSYIAFLPVLVFILLALIMLAGIFSYQPRQEALFKVFIEEKNLWFLIYSTIMVVILGPLVEEVFFRGFIYNAVKRRWGVKLAMITTAVVFAGLHGNLFGFLPIMALAFLLAYVYEKSGSLIPAIAIHILHNGMMVVLLFAGRHFAQGVELACLYH